MRGFGREIGGVSRVEISFTLPLLITLAFGVIEVGRGLHPASCPAGREVAIIGVITSLPYQEFGLMSVFGVLASAFDFGHEQHSIGA